MGILVHMLLLGFAIFVIAQAVPGIRLKGFGTAVIVAVVYSFIDVILGTILKFLSIPFIFLTLGLFLLLINTFLLWITDQLLDDFEIDDLRTTFIAALLITICNLVIGFFY
jgi:putative membrane protein